MKFFYLGTSEVRWLGQANVPLFISHRRLAGRKSFPRALTGWALDSGGFTELSMYGEWRTTAREYNAAVWRYDQEIGNLEFASPNDWRCEPSQRAHTGLTVLEHQRRTIANFQELQDLWPGPDWHVPYVPVIQGWTPDDFKRCVDMSVSTCPSASSSASARCVAARPAPRSTSSCRLSSATTPRSPCTPTG